MAITVTVAQQKGGAGKTTLVIQLATAWRNQGRSVAVVDIDPQASLTAWMRAREHRSHPAPELRFSMIGGWRLGVELDRLKGDVDLVLVDTPPHAETDAKAAIRACDFVLIPCQPSPLDVWACNATIELAKKERRQAALLLNRVPPRARTIEETRAGHRRAGCHGPFRPARQPPGVRFRYRPGPGGGRERAAQCGCRGGPSTGHRAPENSTLGSPEAGC